MNKVNRNPTEFDEKFLEQVALLLLACRNFDEGYEYASLHIAVSLRTLLYDSPKNKNFVSILNHIDKRSIKFLDTSLNTEQDVNLGLVTKRFTTPWKETTPPTPDVENFTIAFKPFCHNISHFSEEELKKREAKWKTIDEWLGQPICINANFTEAKLTRLDLIKATADRDGGAHLDKTVEEEYDHFRFGFTGLNEKNREEWADTKILNIPIYPILRQMVLKFFLALSKLI